MALSWVDGEMVLNSQLPLSFICPFYPKKGFKIDIQGIPDKEPFGFSCPLLVTMYVFTTFLVSLRQLHVLESSLPC